MSATPRCGECYQTEAEHHSGGYCYPLNPVTGERTDFRCYSVPRSGGSVTITSNFCENMNRREAERPGEGEMPL